MSNAPDFASADIRLYNRALVLRDVRRIAARLSVAGPPQAVDAVMRTINLVAQQINTLMNGETPPADDEATGESQTSGSRSETYSDGREVSSREVNENHISSTIIHHHNPGQPDDPPDRRDPQLELCPSCEWEPVRDYLESCDPKEAVDGWRDEAILELVRLGFIEPSPDAPDDERYTDEELISLFYGSPSDDLAARVRKDAVKRDQPNHDS